MEKTIEAIRNKLKEGKFLNEASISQGIVQRFLALLDWPVYDTEVVYPEYPLEQRRIDFALCHPPLRPIIFIEVKQPGKIEGADRQLFEYAFHQGVPMAILTDGAEWHFFLPAEKGRYSERRVYRLDLLEREIDEIVYRLRRYLSYQESCNGKTLESARKDYKDVTKRREVKETMPEAWNKLVEEGDDMLIELISEKVESLCGYKPDPDDVINFLNDLTVDNHKKEWIQPPTQRTFPKDIKSINASANKIGYELNGNFYKCSSVKEVLISVLKKFKELDSNFLEKFTSLPKHGRTRRFVSKNKEELYRSRPDLAQDYSEHIAKGYWVGTNVGKRQAETVIKLACEVTNFTYGKDIVLFLR